MNNTLLVTIICMMFSFCVEALSFPLPSAYETKTELSKTLLLPNGLKVLIISDKSALASAASLTIASGQRDTPKNLDGLPHLLEHAVFLNTQHKQSTWDDFVNRNNGWSNGSTRTTNTRYHFQIENNAFNEALARFKVMILEPVITVPSVEVALSELDNEFHSEKNSEWRGVLSVIRESTNQRNSASKIWRWQ